MEERGKVGRGEAIRRGTEWEGKGVVER